MSRTQFIKRRHAGFSIVELLVAVAIGLVLTVAVSSVLVGGEGRNRASVAVNDINQGGAYAAYLLDSVVRSAGSGFASRAPETYGCRINARRSGADLLPRTAAWPAPFGGFTQQVRVAPVIIGKGQSAAGSDVIAVMRGNAGVGEAALEVLALGPPLGLRNTIGLNNGDLLLLADGDNDCLLLQTTGLASPPLNAGVDTVELLGGPGLYHTVVGANRDLAGFGTPTPSTVVVNLGSGLLVGTNPVNAPQFMLYGVGANRTLFGLDMLSVDGGVPQPLVDGVVEMRALYGLDTNNDGTLDTWADPGVAPFDSASLLSGTPGARARMEQIVALRIGLILQTSRIERETVAPATITLFGDLPAAVQQVRTLSADEQLQRHRSIEITVPLRNVLLARAP
jgi:type IV pilus assembly protein PilW